MARGESDKSEPRSAAIGLWAIFGVVCIGVALLLALTTKACQRWREELGAAPASTGDPFPGARQAFAELGWRDCVAGPDPAEELRAQLSRRGYVLDGTSGPHELPVGRPLEALEGGCGVVAVTGEPGASVGPVRLGEDRWDGCGAPVIAVGVCGAQTVRVEGVGQARLAVWSFPGLTPDDVDRTGMPPDVALAHAEAETVLSARGWHPGETVWRRSLGAGTSAADPGTTPDEGCVPWITVAVGLGAATSTWGPVPIASDAAPERALIAGATCASGGPGRLRFSDPGADGGTLWSLPYATSSGPAVPEEARRITAIGAVRPVDEADDVELPVGLPPE